MEHHAALINGLTTGIGEIGAKVEMPAAKRNKFAKGDTPEID
jgi:hypothetical protein